MASKIDYEDLFTQAWKAANVAMTEQRASRGENPFGCGFAWVTVSPARGPFIAWCRAQGHRQYGRLRPGQGWVFWGPGDYYGQDMDVKYAGAAAFARVLGEAGLRASASSRLD